MNTWLLAAARSTFATIILLASFAAFAFPAAVVAGTRPQIDLLLEVTTTPLPFVPGGHGIVAITLHNAGPDTAGGTLSGQESINVYEDEFIITTQPPPFEVRDPVIGCRVERFVSEPLPNGDIGLVFAFYFGPIPAGESRTCTYAIEFDPSTRESFATGWIVTTPNDDDADLSNNRVDYVFQAPAVSIPTASRHGLIALGFCLLLIGWIWRRGTPRFSLSKP